ncbi:hypothetical protein Tco_1565371 [Tanacetum coccineum]
MGEPVPNKSPFQKNLEKPNSKITAAWEKKDQHNLAKAQANHTGEGGSKAPRKKRKEPATSALNDTTRYAANVEREVVNLSGNAHVSNPLAAVNQPLPRPDHRDTSEHTTFDAQSFHSPYHEDTEEDVADGRCSDMERELLDRLKDLKNERDDWRQLVTTEEKVRAMEGEKVTLVAELAQAELFESSFLRWSRNFTLVSNIVITWPLWLAYASLPME